MTTLILGIESSCDETAAAVVADGRVMRSNVVSSSEQFHQANMDRRLPAGERLLPHLQLRFGIMALPHDSVSARELQVDAVAPMGKVWRQRDRMATTGIT